MGEAARLVLKEQDVFAVMTESGEIPEGGAFGLYARDTRFVSTYRLEMEDGEGLAVLEAGLVAPYAARIFMTNTGKGGPRPRPAHSVAVERTLVVTGEALVERIRLTNYGHEPLALTLRLRVGADFRDIMAIRGMAAREGGRLQAPQAAAGPGTAWLLAYVGEDGIRRQLVVACSGECQAQAAEGRLEARWPLALGPGERRELTVWMAPCEGETAPRLPTEPLEQVVDRSLARLSAAYREWMDGTAAIRVEEPRLHRLLQRGAEDLRALVSDFGEGPFPVAGIPWFAAPFGRDSLWTAYFVLPFAPALARGVLRTLARHQATAMDDWTDAEPGKILHEVRFGELAKLGLIPHRPYYGTVDATPLFVALAADYTRTTGDRETFEAIEEAVFRAVEWMERYGDLDGDGFLEYRRRSWGGLENQGWKDSWDSTWHADGTLAQPPIALVEVQAYAYRAYRSLSELLLRMGRRERAEELASKAEALADRFDRVFWLEDLGFYAHALDGARRPLAVVTSNPGHGLWAGIVPPHRLDPVVRRLMAPDLFSGYGVRTVAKGQARYNPMSYHNGSVWPHDTAIVAAGLARYGRLAEAARLLRGLLDAADHFEGARLPELFCGFDRADGPPVPYPTACSPQAWAAAAPFFMLATLIGLEVDGLSGNLRVGDRLPAWLGEVEVDRLAVGGERVRLLLRPSGRPDGDGGDGLVEATSHIERPAR